MKTIYLWVMNKRISFTSRWEISRGDIFKTLNNSLREEKHTRIRKYGFEGYITAPTTVLQINIYNIVLILKYTTVFNHRARHIFAQFRTYS